MAMSNPVIVTGFCVESIYRNRSGTDSTGISVIFIIRSLKILLTQWDCPIYKVTTPSSGGVCSWCQRRRFEISGNGYNSSFFEQNRVGNEGMDTGIVKWFNDAKGFGFITSDNGGEDLFAHFSEIKMDGFKTLKENQRVSFDVKVGPKGKQAANIQAI